MAQHPPAPAPDTKDWTVVVTQGCLECRYQIPLPTEIPPRILATVEPWRQALAGPEVRVRPEPTVWSPLEYGCHVRDVCRVFLGRIEAIKAQDDVRFLDWDQDEAAIAGRYWEADPAEVAEEYAQEAERVVDALTSATPAQWGHRGVRSNGSAFTLTTLAVYLLHDLEHHYHDVAGSLPR